MSESVTTVVPLENGSFEIFSPGDAAMDAESEKEAGEKKYGDVKFADPENSKYPIDTPEHIRAAWNYIHKRKNAGEYSGDKVAEIKRRIVSAWKSKIDKDGPPEANSEDSMAEHEEDKRSDAEKIAERLDAVLKRMDEFGKRMDAFDKRKDASEEEEKEPERKDGESEEAYSVRLDAFKKGRKDCTAEDAEEEKRADGKRKDAEREEEREEEREDKKRKDAKRKDAEREEEDRKDAKRRDGEREEERKDAKRKDAERQDAADMSAIHAEIAKLKKMLMTQPDADARNRMAEIRKRAEEVGSYYNDEAPAPLPGEDLHSFRVRVLRKYQSHSPTYKDVDLLTVPPNAVFDAVENTIFQDAITAARTAPAPTNGRMRIREYKDEAGRKVTERIGPMNNWAAPFIGMSYVGSLNTAKGVH